MEFIDPMAVKEKNKGDMMYSESRFLGHYLFEKSGFPVEKNYRILYRYFGLYRYGTLPPCY